MQHTPPSPPLKKSQFLPLFYVALAGAMLPLALAPANLWWLAFICPAVLFYCMQSLSSRQAMIHAALFGSAMYTTGASWVFVSIYGFGGASAPLAILLTAIFVLGLGALFGLCFAPFACLRGASPTVNLWLFIATWICGEWIRGWFLTGFPWLYLGYSQLNTPLAGFSPVVGVLGLGLITLLVSLLLSVAISRRKLWPAAVVVLIVSSGWGLQQIAWTQAAGPARTVAVIQGNIPQEKKWDPDFYQTTINRYLMLSQPYWETSDWMIWPEAAIPDLYHRALPLLQELDIQARLTNTSFITGVLYDDFTSYNDYDTYKIFNSVIGLGQAQGIYHKQHLVPFGEYVPLEQWLRQTIQFFNLPTSIIAPGPDGQTGLKAGQTGIAPSLCYEIVFADDVARFAQQNEVLLTISNDAWFGDSLGPHQHLQMAQMRAQETGRYLIRATNNGISAIVDNRGRITASTPQFQQGAFSAEVTPYKGQTPFMVWTNWPVLMLIVTVLTLAGVQFYRRPRALQPS